MFRQFHEFIVFYRVAFNIIKNSTINLLSTRIISKKLMTSNKQQTIDFFVSQLITRFRDDVNDIFVTRSQSITIRFSFAFVFIFNVSSITQFYNFIFEFVKSSIFNIKVIIDTFDISTKKIIYN